MSPEKASFILTDLARWQFGELLARRAAFHAVAPDKLGAEVRAYRYGIACSALKDEALRRRSLAEPLVGAPWELMMDWAEFGQGLAWGVPAEAELSARFIARMQNFGTPTDALRRFARGKAFKYGRRVLHLSESFHEP